MLSMMDAARRVVARRAELGTEDLPLLDAVGRTVARTFFAPTAVPPWDNAAMDGYAVRASDTGPGVTLELVGVVGAGAVASDPLQPGQAMAIMTGAPLPEGADAVIMVEHTDGAERGAVRLDRAVEPGTHVRRRGEDRQVGDAVVRAGERLTPARIGLLAAVGHSFVTVRRPPRIGVLSTGDEIVRPGRPLAPGQIYSSNPYALVGMLREFGAEAEDLGDAPDDLDGLVELLTDALHFDAIVTTGGVSVGRYDHVKVAFARIGAEMDFWKVRMKPGKPFAFGAVSRDGRTTVLFGLPGNPVSCTVGAAVFVGPWIRASLGRESVFPQRVRARMEADLPEKPGRAKLLRVQVRSGPEGLLARPTGPQGSGVLSSMARAHALLVRGPDEGGVRAGDDVDLLLLDPDALLGPDPDYP